MSPWKGNPKQKLILTRVLTQSQGRLVILSGEKGVGKTTLALLTLAELYGESFLLSPNFQFFRLDEYAIKLSFYLTSPSPEREKQILLWGLQFLSHLSQLIALKEIKTKSIKYKENLSMDDFRSLVYEKLMDKTFAKLVQEDTLFQKAILSLAEEISEKKSIPIAFIQEVIRFHKYKSYIPHITFIGGWENATPEAQNASLKLFEEMGESSRIILQTNSLEDVLPTILSRSLMISFPNLSPATVSEILGIPASFSNCFLQMRETLFHEHSRAVELAQSFAKDLAWHIQYDAQIFAFVESLSQNKTSIPVFLDALLEILKEEWISRQKNLRGYETQSLSTITVYTTELKEWMNETLRIKSLITKTYMQASYLVTDLLIRMARWIQKRRPL
ncbi:DNA polymerase III subunit delta' [Thermospira aquatica]|uniref:ATP-binding protein n=1 Tax=Thermospira aquatica TaxID=2828656 RepID=A0AAX3BF38_9SPIR|nr:hypothetical protein [Thermospira aquatica]URA10963.1 hypothetical protein KDW03_03930 [Thermospira aquatica]